MSSETTFKNVYFQEGAKAIAMPHVRVAITAVDKAIAYMIQNFAEDITLDDLAAAAGITKFNLCRAFQKRHAITPMKWLWTFRTLLSAEFIRMAPAWSLTDVAFTCGFTSSAHYSRTFSAMFSMAPSEFRRLAKERREQDSVKAAVSDYEKIYEDNKILVHQAYDRMIKHLEAQRR